MNESRGYFYAVLTISLMGMGTLWSSGAAAQSNGAPVAVVELFTSQGCSSCPPADALLATYAMRRDVIALSLPVDYWDRLGWKDTFASRSHTNRQREYARVRGDGEIYTPQVVVNGRVHVNGSSETAIEGGIAETGSSLASTYVPIRLRLEGGSLLVEVGIAPAASAATSGTLVLVAIQKSGTVSIGRGENAGRSVTYHNIVRALKPIGNWSGVPGTIRLAEADISVPGTQSAVVLLQQGAGGPIIGAAQIRTAKTGL